MMELSKLNDIEILELFEGIDSQQMLWSHCISESCNMDSEITEG